MSAPPPHPKHLMPLINITIIKVRAVITSLITWSIIHLWSAQAIEVNVHNNVNQGLHYLPVLSEFSTIHRAIGPCIHSLAVELIIYKYTLRIISQVNNYSQQYIVRSTNLISSARRVLHFTCKIKYESVVHH